MILIKSEFLIIYIIKDLVFKKEKHYYNISDIPKLEKSCIGLC